MKKSSIAASTAFLTILLAVIMLPSIKAEINWPYNYACTCNHYNPGDINTIWDIYVGTGIQAHYAYQWVFDWVYYNAFQRGTGGYYMPCASPGYDCLYYMYEWFEQGMGYRSWGSSNGLYDPAWVYPYNPFGSFPYYAQSCYVYFGVTNGLYAGGSCGAYFQWPPYPWTYWYDSGSLAQAYAQP
jgi:hypothetical protein